jgi:hypothetical protein
MGNPMEAKPLILTLTAGTTVIWTACAWGAWKAATVPLFGLLPLGVWTSVSEEKRYLLLFPIMVYLCVPVLAWTRNSKAIAWGIPIAPLVGAACFITQMSVAKFIVQSVLE